MVNNTTFCLMFGRCRSLARAFAIFFSYILLTLLFLPVSLQSKDATFPSHLMPGVDTNYFAFNVDEEFAIHNESRTRGGISFLFDYEAWHIFEANPSLPLHSESIDKQRFTAYPKLPEEPILTQFYYAPIIDTADHRYVRYDLYKDSGLQSGGNIKLPLSVPWSRGNTNRSGMSPYSIYIGTYFDYSNVAKSLQSWKSGNNTQLSSDLHQIGSEWLDTRSGYINFEWQFGK